nr:MAG TPA: hypothetical protein [Caudoviricetes sp.]
MALYFNSVYYFYLNYTTSILTSQHPCAILLV